MKHIISIIIIFMATFLSIHSQEPYEEVINQIKINNPQLKKIERTYEAYKIDQKSNLNLEDPEFEYSYSKGKPHEIGTRIEYSIKQSFDFPTTYMAKRKIASESIKNIDNMMLNSEREIMLEVKRICINLIYCNAEAKWNQERLQQAETIAKSHSKQLDNGEISIITYNKAILNKASVKQELTENEILRDELLNRLEILNGGKRIDFNDDSFPERAMPSDMESWYEESVISTPYLNYLQKEVDISKHKISYARSKHMPKISVGYAYEREMGERFNGVVIGVSIPLWENRRKVRLAKTEAIVAQMESNEALMEHKYTIKNLFKKAHRLKENVDYFKEIHKSRNNALLVKKAFDAGEMSLLEYLVEIEIYNESITKAREAQRDLELTMVELMSYI